MKLSLFHPSQIEVLDLVSKREWAFGEGTPPSKFYYLQYGRFY